MIITVTNLPNSPDLGLLSFTLLFISSRTWSIRNNNKKKIIIIASHEVLVLGR